MCNKMEVVWVLCVMDNQFEFLHHVEATFLNKSYSPDFFN
jgi:hypothetical protein